MGLIGVSELRAALTKITAETELAGRQIVATGTAMVEKEAKGNFSGSHARNMPHEGGDQPNVVSGDLRRSIMTTPIVRLGLASYQASVGPSMIYGRRVELGMNGSRKFPYFEPSVKKVKPLLSDMAAMTWRKALRI